MAILKSYCVCLRESTPKFLRPNLCDNYRRRNAKWKSPQAAVIPYIHLPMRSFEVKNSYQDPEQRYLKVRCDGCEY